MNEQKRLDLPQGWASARLPDLLGPEGLIVDGDWVESKDQDPNGTIRLTQLADVGDGVFRDRSRRFMNAEQAERLGCTLLAPGDLLIARMPDPLGRACLFPEGLQPCVTVVDVCIVRPGTSGISSRWLMGSINAPQFRVAVSDLQGGSTRQRISKKNLTTLSLPVPPLPEQQRIVEALDSYLSRLDESVALLERVQRNLKRYRASVLRAAVTGKLVPTEAEMARAEGRDYEPASVLLERILAERRRRWAESGKKGKYEEPAAPETADLPELPEGWCWATVDMVAEVGTGATPNRGDARYWSGGSIPWVTSAVAGLGLVVKPSDLVTPLALNETNLTRYPIGTLLIAMYGEGKTRGQCAELRIEATTNQALAALETVGAAVLARPWLRLYMDFNYNNVRRQSAGGVQPNLNLSIVRRIAVSLPPLAEQRRISDETSRLLSVADVASAEANRGLRRLARLRQSILNWAFEGKLVDQDPNDENAAVLLDRLKAAQGQHSNKRNTT
jgi:type I restriction enzyme S subunit